jgi:hypothetical protein
LLSSGIPRWLPCSPQVQTLEAIYDHSGIEAPTSKSTGIASQSRNPREQRLAISFFLHYGERAKKSVLGSFHSPAPLTGSYLKVTLAAKPLDPSIFPSSNLPAAQSVKPSASLRQGATVNQKKHLPGGVCRRKQKIKN